MKKTGVMWGKLVDTPYFVQIEHPTSCCSLFSRSITIARLYSFIFRVLLVRLHRTYIMQFGRFLSKWDESYCSKKMETVVE